MEAVGRHHTLIYYIHRLGGVLGFNILNFNISADFKINIYMRLFGSFYALFKVRVLILCGG